MAAPFYCLLCPGQAYLCGQPRNGMVRCCWKPAVPAQQSPGGGWPERTRQKAGDHRSALGKGNGRGPRSACPSSDARTLLSPQTRTASVPQTLRWRGPVRRGSRGWAASALCPGLGLRQHPTCSGQGMAGHLGCRTHSGLKPGLWGLAHPRTPAGAGSIRRANRPGHAASVLPVRGWGGGVCA